MCSPSVSRHGRFVSLRVRLAARVARGALRAGGRAPPCPPVRPPDGRTRTLTRGADADSEFPAISPDGAAVASARWPDSTRPTATSSRTSSATTCGAADRARRRRPGRRGLLPAGDRIAWRTVRRLRLRLGRRRARPRARDRPGGGAERRAPAHLGAGERIAFESADPLLPGGSPSETEVYTLRRAWRPAAARRERSGRRAPRRPRPALRPLGQRALDRLQRDLDAPGLPARQPLGRRLHQRPVALDERGQTPFR